MAKSAPLLLDGATGTELERRGLSCGLPLWSTHALIDDPEKVFEVHADYVAAGADLLTANTFRTQRRTLTGADPRLDPRDLTTLAVSLARRAADAVDREVFVLGSAPTLEDCYRPDLVPDDAALAREHTEHAANLAAAGVDAIVVETMNTIREAEAAADAARSTGLTFLVSFVCGTDARLLSGEPLSDAVRIIRSVAPAAVLVNCLPTSQVEACLKVLRDEIDRFGVYANLGEPIGAARSEDRTSDEYANDARRWIDVGARIIGGCCGTTPDHIAALRSMIDSLRR